MPPFNPTDYFRDMIFTTDFMVEQEFYNGVDNNGFGGNQNVMGEGGVAAQSDVTPIDEIVNEEDAEMAEEANE